MIPALWCGYAPNRLDAPGPGIEKLRDMYARWAVLHPESGRPRTGRLPVRSALRAGERRGFPAGTITAAAQAEPVVPALPQPTRPIESRLAGRPADPPATGHHPAVGRKTSLDGSEIIDRMTATPPYQPPPKSARQVPSVLDLIDVRFERRFGPILVQWFYLATLIVIATTTLFGILMSGWLASRVGWTFWLGVPISLATGMVWTLCLRLVCEHLIRWTGPDPAAKHAGRPVGHHS